MASMNRSRRDRFVTSRLAIERLESRHLLSISSAFDAEKGELSIVLDADDDVIVESVDFMVKINGADVPGRSVEITAVESIVVTAAGEFANEVDLSDVSVFNFPFLKFVTVDAGPGDDLVWAPLADSALTMGEGADTMQLASVIESKHVTVTDSVQVLLGPEFTMEPDSTLTFFGQRSELLGVRGGARMQEGSLIESLGGDITFRAFRPSDELIMEDQAAISSTSGSIQIVGCALRMRDGSRITSDVGNIEVEGSVGHDIAHISTSRDVRIFSDRGEVIDAGDVDVDIAANHFELDSFLGAGDFETSVNTISGSSMTVTNAGDLGVGTVRLDSSSLELTAVADSSANEEGNLITNSSIEGTTGKEEAFLNAASSLIMRPRSSVFQFSALNLAFGRDLLLENGSSVTVHDITISPTELRVNHNILVESQFGSPPKLGPSPSDPLLSILGGDLNDRIILDSVIVAHQVVVDGKAGGDTYHFSLREWPFLSSDKPRPLSVTFADSGSDEGIDRLAIDLRGAPVVRSDEAISFKIDQRDVTIHFENIESVTLMSTGDFNSDSQIDDLDIDALFAAISSESNQCRFDLNSDQILDLNDAYVLVEDIMRTRVGDLDLDGRVAIDDFLVLSSNFGKSRRSIGWADGDLDGNRRIDFTDFLRLASNYGFGSGS
jgi:hypothetical protein